MVIYIHVVVATARQKNIALKQTDGFHSSNYLHIYIFIYTMIILNLRNYNTYVSDNLDSWCCALTFDFPDG